MLSPKILCPILLLIATFCAAAATKPLTSPNGKLSLELTEKGGFGYSLSGFGEEGLVKGRLGLEFEDQDWPADCKVAKVGKTVIDETWSQPVGIQKVYRDFCNEYAVELEGSFAKRHVDLLIRLYDEGLAFRYVIGAEEQDEYVITKELTDYLFNKDYTCWYPPYGFGTAQEHESVKGTLATIPPGTISGCPLVVKDAKFCLALTETDLRDWAGLYFSNGLEVAGDVLAAIGKMKGEDAARNFTANVSGLNEVVLYHDAMGDNDSDHADWVELRLTDKEGREVKVTKDFIAEEKQGWNSLGFDATVDGNRLTIGGKTYEDGFGGHATGYIVLKLDGKYEKLCGKCGLDSEKGGKGLASFAVMKKRSASSAPYLSAALAPRRDGRGLVLTKGFRHSPWRLVLMGQNELSLITNQMILNCASPCEIGDTSWIKPGRSTWNWWSDWNRDLCTASVKKEIDFASRHGWEYSTVDDPWYSPHMGREGNNVMKGQEGRIDLEELASYAKERNVRLILWMHWADIERMMDEAFAYYEKLGVGGMKIDFMNRDDQEMVCWYEKTCKKAAKNHLLVNFHGSYKPSGFARTFPNQITSEGVRGNETCKWSKEITPKQVVSYAFHRYIQGPADLTPGGFLNRQPEQFKPATPTEVQGTRAHEMALCFVLPTPLLCLCDNPANYEGQPGLEYFDQLKTSWDETLPLMGEIDKYYVCARRNGADWYLGMIGDDQPQAYAVKLDFLEEGKTYTALIFRDAEESAIDATQIDRVTKCNVRKGDFLPIRTVRNGGYVAILKADN